MKIITKLKRPRLRLNLAPPGGHAARRSQRMTKRATKVMGGDLV